jgi:hypothetical protein
VQDVEQAEDFAHPAAYDRQRWARGVGSDVRSICKKVKATAASTT